MQEASAAEHRSSSASQHSTSTRVKFAGPLDDRIIEDSFTTYAKTVGLGILGGISHVLIGIVVMGTSLYSFHKGEFHGALFSMAYHLFAAEGILGLSFINGWSTPMRKSHRLHAHVFLETCAVACAVIGVIAVSPSKIRDSRSFHGFSGLITLILSGMSWVIGPLLMKWIVHPSITRAIRPAIIFHKVLGLLCFFTSSFCLCSGLVLEGFYKWAGKDVVIILLAFVIFYTFVIVYSSCMKYVKLF